MKNVVNENTVLEIGKFYLVKCAIVSFKDKKLFVPVIGRIHKDEKLGFIHKHIHIDGRFCDKENHKKFDMVDGRTNRILTFNNSFAAMYVIGFTEKKLKCHRLITGIRPLPEHRAFLFHKWVDSMKGKKCKGKKCPHLGTEMFEENGVLVCPLHNLMTDESKSIIVGVKN